MVDSLLFVYLSQTRRFYSLANGWKVSFFYSKFTFNNSITNNNLQKFCLLNYCYVTLIQYINVHIYKYENLLIFSVYFPFMVITRETQQQPPAMMLLYPALVGVVSHEETRHHREAGVAV